MAQAYAPTTWNPGAPPGISAARLNNVETGLVLASAPIVTSLPASPVDGQECNYLADATNGVVWHLVYRVASGKWHMTGGPPLYAEVANGGNPIPSTTYGDLATAGPSLTAPLAGDYILEHGFQGYFSNLGNANPRAIGAPQVGAVAPSNQNAIYMGPGASVPAGQQHDQHASRGRKLTGLTAGTVVAMKYRYENQAPTFLDNRWLVLTPVMVG